MKKIDKTKDELIQELNVLKKEYETLKTKYDKDITNPKQTEENLRESKLQLSSIYDTVGDVIYYLEVEGDEQYRFVSVNTSFCRVTGIPKETIIGKRVNEIIPEPSLGIVLGKYRQAIEGKTIVRWEEISDYPTGRLTGEVNIAPVFNVTGHCTHLVGSVHDITESKKAEEELNNSKLKIEESEIKFKSITNQTTEGISVTDMNGNYKFVNPAFCLMTGYSEEELLKMTAFDLKAKTQIDSTFFENKTENAGLVKQVNLLRKDQSELMTETIGKIIIIGNQEFALGTHRDITERKREEEILRNSEERFRTIFENAPILIDGFNENGKCILWNKECEKIFGWTIEELNSYEDSLSLFYPDPKIREQVIKTVIFDPENIFREWHPQTKNGTVKTCMWANYKLPEGIIINIGYDITERKQTELIIQQQKNKLQELNAEKDKLFSIIAHDLKSPFLGFLNITEIMATESKSFTISEFAKYSQTLNNSAVNLYKLLENLLKWATIRQGKISFNLQKQNLYSMVSQNISTNMDRAKQKGITIINQVEDSVNVSADKKMIDSVLRNLLSNAVKFTRKDGTITINAKPIENGIIEISISDNGIGIDDDIVKKLFKVGERIGSKGTDGELSTGLGLLLCKEFIEKHNGKIWAESEEGKGSTFYFTLQKVD